MHLATTLTELGLPHETIADIGGALAPFKSQIVGVPTLWPHACPVAGWRYEPATVASTR